MFPSASNQGNIRYWTREQTLKGLQVAMAEIEGPLPCTDHIYNPMKRGHFDWPVAMRIYEFFGSLAHGWLAAGAETSRVDKFNTRWCAYEIAYLDKWAGIKSLKDIGKNLGRSYQATRGRFGGKGSGINARDHQGWMSASQVAKDYDTTVNRVTRMLKRGTLPGTFSKMHNSWRVEPLNFTEEMVATLRKPKVTHKSGPTDHGDWSQRNNLYRTQINGKTVRVTDKYA